MALPAIWFRKVVHTLAIGEGVGDFCIMVNAIYFQTVNSTVIFKRQRRPKKHTGVSNIS